MRQGPMTCCISVCMMVLLGCSRPKEPTSEAREVESNEQVSRNREVVRRQFIIKAKVVHMTALGVGTSEGKAILHTVAQSAERSLTQAELTQVQADLATIMTSGFASVVSQPSVVTLDGQSASVTVSTQVPAGPTTPRQTRKDFLEMECRLTDSGSIEGRYRLLTTQETGEIEHAGAAVGLALGDRALINIEVVSDHGMTVAGGGELSPTNDLGGAFVLLVAPQVLPTE